MKLQIEKPSDQVMRFFTPDLFVRFNSPDDEVADRANAEWEAMVRTYHGHLADLGGRMPAQVKELAELCLHDAELLVVEPFLPLFPEVFPFWNGCAILSLGRHREVVSLNYVLWDRIREHPPGEDWPFAKSRKHWLYDEVDVDAEQEGLFIHRILLSDGSIVEIPFGSVIIHQIPLRKESDGEDARQIA